MKLTEPMLKALREVACTGYSYSISFQTGEALRRRGLLARHTEYLIKAVYVDQDSETLQYRYPARSPLERHEWMLTKAGRNLLDPMSRLNGC